MDDGVLALTFSWVWGEEFEQNIGEPPQPPDTNQVLYYNIYRVDAMTLEAVLLERIDRPSDIDDDDDTVIIWETGTYSTTIRDYSVEMGAEYIYMGFGFNHNNESQHTLVWGDNPGLLPTAWNPPIYPGYGRQTNFDGNVFLTTKWQQLKLQGNVQISNFRRNTSDQITTTIGGQYPFYSRSAQFNYRTLSLQGLISLNFDVTNTFLRFKSQVISQAMQDALDAAVARYLSSLANIPHDVHRQRNISILQEQYYNEVRLIFQGIDPVSGNPFPGLGDRPFWMSGQLWYRHNRDLEQLVLRTTELFDEEQFSPNVARIRKQLNIPGDSIIQVDKHLPVRGPTSIFHDHLARNATHVRDSDRTDDLIYAERKFREAVMQWASDGQPKLFRSETEGNMIVMLSGVGFAPYNRQRRLYSISATVTEVAEYNLSNLIQYGLVPIDFDPFVLPYDIGFTAGSLDLDPGVRRP
jgi:hypothetical protein